MRVLILVNGDPPSAAVLERLRGEHDLFLATDGAAHRASGLGQSPDLICGDFDSIDLEVARAEFSLAEFVPTPDQDYADLEKAVLLARSRGASSITIVGAMGGRIDHALGNFAVMLRYHSELPIALVDEHSVVRVISSADTQHGAWRLDTMPGDTISLVSLDGRATVSLSGVKWPLSDHRVPVGTHGISNVALAKQIRIEVSGGAVVVCHLSCTSSTV